MGFQDRDILTTPDCCVAAVANFMDDFVTIIELIVKVNRVMSPGLVLLDIFEPSCRGYPQSSDSFLALGSRGNIKYKVKVKRN